MCSRVLPRIVSVAVKGTASGGKSYPAGGGGAEKLGFLMSCGTGAISTSLVLLVVIDPIRSCIDFVTKQRGFASIEFRIRPACCSNNRLT
jgi:hypothetical protein